MTQPRAGRESREGSGSSPDRVPVGAARRHGGRFALLALAALFAVRLPLPWMGAAVVLVVAADVEGVRAARAIARERLRRGLLYWCICGVALITLLGLGAAGTLALYPITYQRQECLEGANTGVARAACQHQFDRRISRLQDTFGG